jgi:S-adenosylmethionine:tRNA ribosyltransferase-isomerase
MARHISISEFTYHLPEEKIASHPLSNRDESKLLVYKNETIHDTSFNNISSHLPEKSLLVFNKTKVVCARILFSIPEKEKKVEIFILEPAGNLSIEEAMLQKGNSKWICLVGNNREFKNDFLEKKFYVEENECTLKVLKPKKKKDSFEVEFIWSNQISFSEILNVAGLTPLPPYLKRKAQESDKARYQTVYAKEEGSVAAPTAGLHFTNNLLKEIIADSHAITELTLHVGAGTFRPVKSQQMEDHLMHSEEIIVSRDTLVELNNNYGKIIAVGTTSLRTLETLFWLGLKLKLKNDIQLVVSQWDAYDLKIPPNFYYTDAINELISYLDTKKEKSIRAKTALLIAPGYTIQSVKGLITNFHQPNSTLLLLVAALIGNHWKNIYEHALKHNYRFLSFGDSSLLLRSEYNE